MNWNPYNTNFSEGLGQKQKSVWSVEAKQWGLGILVMMLGLGAMHLGYNKYQTKNRQAHNLLFQAVYYFEAGDLDNALQGDGLNLGFLEIIDQYRFTSAAGLAKCYAGIIYA